MPHFGLFSCQFLLECRQQLWPTGFVLVGFFGILLSSSTNSLERRFSQVQVERVQSGRWHELNQISILDYHIVFITALKIVFLGSFQFLLLTIHPHSTYHTPSSRGEYYIFLDLSHGSVTNGTSTNTGSRH